MSRLPRIAFFLVALAASGAARARADDAPVRVSVEASPAVISFGERVRLSVRIENRGAVPAIYRAPLPPYTVHSPEGGRRLAHSPPVELVPCVIRERCESVRIAPGRSERFEIELSPTEDLGITSAGEHSLIVGVEVFLLEPNRALPPEREFTATTSVEIADKVAETLYTCLLEDARLSLAAKAAEDKGTQEELRIEITLTNQSDKPLTIPSRPGCPNTAEFIRLYPPDFQGRVSELGKTFGPGAPELCPYARRDDFVTLNAGKRHEIELSLDPLEFGPVPPGRYEAVVAVRNELAQWADEDGNWHALDDPWIGCVRTPGIALEVQP